MTRFLAKSNNGQLSLGSAYNANRFRQFLRENNGITLAIEPVLPESDKLRRFFEGAVVPLFVFFQEELDHRNYKHCAQMRELLKLQFNAELVPLNGKVVKIPGSTKGKLGKGFLELAIRYLEENYSIDRFTVLDPPRFKHWRDEIYPLPDGPDNYIDYLLSIGLLERPGVLLEK